MVRHDVHAACTLPLLSLLDSVDSLAVVLRQAIENEKKLTHELVMPGAVFQIKEVDRSQKKVVRNALIFFFVCRMC